MLKQEWTTAYEIYARTNPEIDVQHKQLFQILIDLDEDSIQRKSQEELDDIIRRINVYRQEHFLSEEILMIKYDYPSYVSHKEEHESFIKDTNAIIQKTESTGITLTLVLADYIKSWLISHMLGSDKLLAEYLVMVSV